MLRAPAALPLLLLAASLAGCLKLGEPAGSLGDPRVRIETSLGNVTVELFAKRTPVTSGNFLNYTRAGFYDGLIFHRVIQGFVIQGGGVGRNGTEKPALFPPIPLEIDPQATHVDGCLGMAREDAPDTATSQFYVCDGPQHRLDDAEYRAARGKPGYAVFGKVVEGIGVVRAIAGQPTDSADRPLYDVVILRVREAP
jgi:peptidyl-prolyl cis-trans isomerase A (cyclophilin A)